MGECETGECGECGEYGSRRVWKQKSGEAVEWGKQESGMVRKWGREEAGGRGPAFVSWV